MCATWLGALSNSYRAVLKQRLFAGADLGSDLKSLMGVFETMMSAAARSSVISKPSSARCSDSSG